MKQVCSEYEEALIQLFHTRLVQTNEVNRASYLYPLFDEIYRVTIDDLKKLGVHEKTAYRDLKDYGKTVRMIII